MTKRNSKGIGQKSSFPDSKVNKQTNKRKRKRSLSDVYIGHLRTAADVEAAVTIKKSLIIAAGAGAFTTVDIARGTCLGFYKGIPTTAQQREDPLFSGAYWFESHNRDATDPAGRLKLPGKEEALVNVAGWLKEDWEGVPEGARWNGSTSNWTRFMVGVRTTHHFAIILRSFAIIWSFVPFAVVGNYAESRFGALPERLCQLRSRAVRQMSRFLC